MPTEDTRPQILLELALFSMDEDNPRIKYHTEEGGLAAIYENGYITISKGGNTALLWKSGLFLRFRQKIFQLKGSRT